MSQPDPITVEVLGAALKSAADEMYVSLARSAYSTNIKERHDHSTAILDAEGRLVVQPEASLPIHIASMSGLTRAIIARFGATLQDGDIFIGNDPYEAGGTHLPDVNMVAPFFCDGRLMGFICNIAHHADMGGMAPGSMAGGMTEIFQEGLRLPAVRLFRAGVLQEDLFDLVLLNVRVPEERRGDYFAQIAACRLGHTRLQEIVLAHGRATVEAVFAALMERAALRLVRALAQVPPGRYRFEDVMDDDGVDASDIPICVEVVVGEGAISFDFTGTAPQVRGNINATFNATQASVCYALKALLDPDIPNNEGVLGIPVIHAPPGSLLNATFPASVASRAHTCQRIIDVVIGALAQALPERAVAAANGSNTTAVFSGVDPRSGQSYVYLETLGGGFGGRAQKDGKDGVQVHITNTSNLPVEAIETEYPLIVESYGFVEDSGGAGRQRGGLALRRVISPLDHDCTFSGAGERFQQQPWGLFGGGAGRAGAFSLFDGGETTTLPSKPLAVPVKRGQRLIVESPGAGAYGPPAARSQADLAEDHASGKFSARFLEAHYGWTPKP